MTLKEKSDLKFTPEKKEDNISFDLNSSKKSTIIPKALSSKATLLMKESVIPQKNI